MNIYSTASTIGTDCIYLDCVTPASTLYGMVQFKSVGSDYLCNGYLPSNGISCSTWDFCHPGTEIKIESAIPQVASWLDPQRCMPGILQLDGLASQPLISVVEWPFLVSKRSSVSIWVERLFDYLAWELNYSVELAKSVAACAREYLISLGLKSSNRRFVTGEVLDADAAVTKARAEASVAPRLQSKVIFHKSKRD